MIKLSLKLPAQIPLDLFATCPPNGLLWIKYKVEVDVVIENAAGDCYAIEVKATATLNAGHFAGLKRFRNIAAKRFKMGILLYDGDHTTAFGEQLFAVPIGSLWS